MPAGERGEVMERNSPALHKVDQIVHQEFRQSLIGGGVVVEAGQHGRDLPTQQRYPQEIRHLLAPLARPFAGLEVQEVTPSQRGGMQEGQPKERRGDLAVPEER